MLLPKLYKRNSNKSVQEWTIEVEDGKYRTISGKQGGKLVESKWTQSEPKNTGKSNETTAEEQAIVEAQAKWDKKVKREYFENINDIDKITFFQPMLAKKYTEHCQKFADVKSKYSQFCFPVLVDVKLNGVRCERHINGVFSRQGEEFFTIPHIIKSTESLYEEFPDLVLDGELYNWEKREHLNRITELVSVNIKEKDLTPELLEESEKIVEYHVYDGFGFIDEKYGLITAETCCFERREAVSRLIKDIHYLKIVKSEFADNEEKIYEILEKYVSNGEEGIIIRLNTPYVNKRTDTLLKLKKFEDAEFKILDIEGGKGNWEHCAKKIWCELDDGKKFKSNVKGTQEFLREVLNNKSRYIGRIITVHYQNLSEYGVPQIPYTDLIIRDYE